MYSSSNFFLCQISNQICMHLDISTSDGIVPTSFRLPIRASLHKLTNAIVWKVDPVVVFVSSDDARDNARGSEREYVHTFFKLRIQR